MNIISFIFGLFKPEILSWIIVLYGVGLYLKNCEKVPNCVIPLLLFTISFVVYSLIGWAYSTMTGYKSFVVIVLEYGLGWGGSVTLIEIFAYDLLHGFNKQFSLTDKLKALLGGK